MPKTVLKVQASIIVEDARHCAMNCPLRVRSYCRLISKENIHHEVEAVDLTLDGSSIELYFRSALCLKEASPAD